MTSPCVQQISDAATEALYQPQPRRLKRALLEETDHPVSTSKRVCLDRISPWLETLDTPVPEPFRSRSTEFKRTAVDTSTRSRSAPIPEMSSYERNLYTNPTPPYSRSTYQSFQSTSSVQYAESASTRATTIGSKTDDPLYRTNHLQSNGIHLRSTLEPLPNELHHIVDQVYAKRNSPTPDLKSWEYDPELIALETGAAETEVAEYFRKKIFPKEKGHAYRSDGLIMHKHALPDDPRSVRRVSQPIPDIAYGYQLNSFTEPQQIQLANMEKGGTANNGGLYYPFLIVEFKADGPHGGESLYVATNQCLAGSASCVKLVTELSDRLSSCRHPAVVRESDAAFSIAMSGTEARLHISWKQSDQTYYMRKLNGYYLQRPEDINLFRAHVLNILDWGSDARKSKRLHGIGENLVALLDASLVEVSKQAKARTPPAIEESVRQRKKQPGKQLKKKKKKKKN